MSSVCYAADCTNLFTITEASMSLITCMCSITCMCIHVIKHMTEMIKRKERNCEKLPVVLKVLSHNFSIKTKEK